MAEVHESNADDMSTETRMDHMSRLGLRFPLDFDLSASSEVADSNSASSMKGYSQKNYHIGDGTLYSVMIPHQSKQVAKTYRGSTPGRGRGRGRGSRGQSSSRARKVLKFHHQALPAEYLEHYARRQRGEGVAPQLTPDVLTAAARSVSCAVRPETLSRVASVIAANSRRDASCELTAPPARLRRRGRPRGRGRGSRAIPGFIQEVHDNMNKAQERILVEKSHYDGDSVFPTSVSARLVKPAPTPLTTAVGAHLAPSTAAATTPLASSWPTEETRLTSASSDDPSSTAPSLAVSPVSVLQTLLSLGAARTDISLPLASLHARLASAHPQPDRTRVHEVIHEQTAREDDAPPVRLEPLNLCVRDDVSESVDSTMLPEEGADAQQYSRHATEARGVSRRKRKRPVHLPPMRPARPPQPDVSIRKFKFKGGANPSLQEKKKLDLANEGPFRFFQNERAAVKHCPGLAEVQTSAI